MRQLLLDIRPDAPPRFGNFVPGANADLLARLQALARPGAAEAVYLWGPPGCGRSHLLRATLSAAREDGRPALLLAGADAGDDFPLEAGALLLVDGVEALAPGAQVALFRAFNDARRLGLGLLLAGSAPPLHLALREDLRTRIGSALVFEVKPLTDEEKAATLAAHAAGRGLPLSRELIDYLLRHGARDLPSLMGVLEDLDRACLEQKRPATLPLLREVLLRRG